VGLCLGLHDTVLLFYSFCSWHRFALFRFGEIFWLDEKCGDEACERVHQTGSDGWHDATTFSVVLCRLIVLF
jgi:hypothetical protein